MGLELVDLAAGLVGDDGRELDDDVLGHHVENELEGQLLLLAGGDLDAVPDGRQIADNGGPDGGILGEGLGRPQAATDKGDVDGRIFVVRDLDERLGDAAVDDLHTEDVGIRPGRLDDGLELGMLDLLSARGLGIDLRKRV